MSSTPDGQKKKKKRWTDSLKFYLTAFFILLAAFSSLAFVFLVPFVIDPGFSTIFAEFDADPLTCVTVETVFKFGLSNCSWSSCREGCTRDVFKCTQIYVNYFRDTEGLLEGKNFTNLDEYQNITWQFKYAKIFPNVKGCGYPPTVNCTIFNESHGENGTTFPCFYSQLQPNVTITQLNIDEIKQNLIYAITIPWSCFIASVLYLLVTYVGMKKPELDFPHEPEDISSKASKEASNYSLRSISKTINQGMSRLRGEPDDKGSPQQSQDRPGGVKPLTLDSSLLLAPPPIACQTTLRRNTLPPLHRTPTVPRTASSLSE